METEKKLEKKDCDIIRDLIPSYADGICSEATRRWVDAHLASCGECDRVLRDCRSLTLSGEKLGERGLDGLKKIRKTLQIQRLACYLMLVFLAFCGIQAFFVRNVSSVLFQNPMALFLVCALLLLLSSLGYRGREPLRRRDYLLGGASLALDLYFFLAFLCLALRVQDRTGTFWGMELLQAGPFLERQLMAGFLAQLAFFAYTLWGIIGRDRRGNWLLCLNMMGIFLLLRHELWMMHMDIAETLLQVLFQETAEIAGIGLLGIAASLLIARLTGREVARPAS